MSDTGTTFTSVTGSGAKDPIPLTRLVRVELRKMYDTRAGFWLLVAIAAVTAVVMVIFLVAADDPNRTFTNIVGITATPQGFLLPVLGILLVTQEWGQRTGMVTFTLTPQRGRVILAKIAAALLLGLAAVLFAVGLAALFTALFGGTGAWDGVGPDDVAKILLLQVTGVLQGLAFGLILLSSAAAIVLFFVLPTAFSIVASLWSWLRGRAAWVDLGTSQRPLFDGSHMSGEQWAQVATSTALWVALPFLLGLWRVLRAEVK